MKYFDLTFKALIVLLLIILAWHPSLYAGTLGNSDNLEKVYSDESHCLIDPEIRGESDKPNSCYCRDAIVNARYVYQNYVITEKDQNLNGVHLALLDYADGMCGEHHDVLKASESTDWQWNGPQVTREYPPDNEIDKLQPDSKGFRTVKYKVHLTYRDQQGRVTTVENFTALEKLPTNPKK
ncbi:MAG: hypothetical protein ABSD73_12550 [Candidatus Bathyarchaeia archaeon]